MLTHPNCIFATLYFGPSGVFGSGPSNFNALEIDQGLLVRTTNGDGGPPKNCKGEQVKFGLKFRV